MEMKTSTIYNKQNVQFKRVLDSVFIMKADGQCYGDVIGDATINHEIGYMTVRLFEHGKERAEITLYKPYTRRPTIINHFLANNGYVLV